VRLTRTGLIAKVKGPYAEYVKAREDGFAKGWPTTAWQHSQYSARLGK